MEHKSGSRRQIVLQINIPSLLFLRLNKFELLLLNIYKPHDLYFRKFLPMEWETVGKLFCSPSLVPIITDGSQLNCTDCGKRALLTKCDLRDKYLKWTLR